MADIPLVVGVEEHVEEHAVGRVAEYALGRVAASAASSEFASGGFADVAVKVNAGHAEGDAEGVDEAAYAGGGLVDAAVGIQVGSLADTGGWEMLLDPY